MAFYWSLCQKLLASPCNMTNTEYLMLMFCLMLIITIVGEKQRKGEKKLCTNFNIRYGVWVGYVHGGKKGAYVLLSVASFLSGNLTQSWNGLEPNVRPGGSSLINFGSCEDYYLYSKTLQATCKSEIFVKDEEYLKFSHVIVHETSIWNFYDYQYIFWMFPCG